MLLTALRRDCPGAEIIVADGGSDDETLAIARGADRVVSAPAGRAAQMNAGAAVATGSVLWFLHVDSIPPRDALAHIGEILASGCCGGCFRIWFDEPAWVFRIGDALSNLKVDLTGIAYGDHGFLLHRRSLPPRRRLPGCAVARRRRPLPRARPLGRRAAGSGLHFHQRPPLPRARPVAHHAHLPRALHAPHVRLPAPRPGALA